MGWTFAMDGLELDTLERPLADAGRGGMDDARLRQSWQGAMAEAELASPPAMAPAAQSPSPTVTLPPAEAAESGIGGMVAARLLSRLAGGAAASLLIPTNTQRVTSEEPVAGHPELGAEVSRAPGSLSGKATLFARGPDGQPGQGLTTLDLDAQGTLTASATDRTPLGQRGPDGVALTPAAADALAARLAPGAQTAAQNACDANGAAAEAGEQADSAQTAGLPAELQSDFKTARANAHGDDPALQAVFPYHMGDKTTSGACATWQAHHLMSNAQVKANADLFGAAAKAGWRPDEAANVLGLPHDQTAQGLLSQAGSGRPLHDNSHQENYKQQVVRAIEQVKQEIPDIQAPAGSDAYNQQVRVLIEQEQEKLRTRVMSLGLGRLTMAEPTSAEQPT